MQHRRHNRQAPAPARDDDPRAPVPADDPSAPPQADYLPAPARADDARAARPRRRVAPLAAARSVATLPAFILLWASPLHAHVADSAAAPPALGSAWTLDPWLLAPLGLALLIYAGGVVRIWRRAGIGRGIRRREATAHAGGMLALFVALVWPLDALGEWSLAVHMTQHMLLLAVAAPLLLLGRPGVAWLAALPTDPTRRLARGIKRASDRGPVAVLTGTTAATLLQALVMWGWHSPAAMELALASDPVHYAMHASFLGAGLLFWRALLQSVREPGAGFGAGTLALVGTMVQMGLLSALLTFARTPRFAFYVDRSEMLGLTALQDQQLAGLIMWVPSALPYLIGMLLLMAAWLRRAQWQDARSARHASGVSAESNVTRR